MKAEYDFSKAKRGAVIPQTGKTRINIYIDDDILAQFQELADQTGKGYQTMMNEALRAYLNNLYFLMVLLEIQIFKHQLKLEML